MHRYRSSAPLASLCLAISMLSVTAFAQTSDPDAIEIPIGPGGQAYQDAVSSSRINTELIYLHPQADETLPREAARKTVPANTERWPNAPRYTFITILIAVLAALVVFAAKSAPNMTIARRSPGNDRRPSVQRGRPNGEGNGSSVMQGGSDFLNELRMMADRRAALILLSKRALERAVEINNLPLGRSQTAREILRKLPGSWVHHPALKTIIGFEERVQFGGQDLPEPVFQESLKLAEPLFTAETGQ